MNEPRYPRVLAKALGRRFGREPRPVPLAMSADEIALVQDALGRLAARRRARFVAGGCGLALLVAGAAMLPRLWTHPVDAPAQAPVAALGIVASSSGQGTTVVSEGSSFELAAQQSLPPGSRIVVGPTGPAHLSLSTGSRVTLEPGSDVTLAGQGRAAIFSIGAGSLLANVAKLAPSDRFLVRTADSEVEVRGTSFQVSIVPPDPSCGDGTTTRVHVYEGIVVVRRDGREQSIEKGEEWPSGCQPPSAQPVVAQPAAAPPPEARDEARTPTRATPPRPSVSDLGAQNDQFADAMILKRRGDSAAALAAFDRFLAMHPTSHLAENAAAERMKLLAPVDRTAARAAARQYLQKYPSGFAGNDARAILAVPARP
jgi:ferric-dicitrate binding protein FerR (iron transport regulator)